VSGSRLKERVAIVTGGGRGIGRAIAARFAAEGARVLVVTRTATFGEEAVADIRAAGGAAELLAVNLGSRTAAAASVARAAELWGKLDIVVHNAAESGSSSIVEMSDEQFARSFDVNASTSFWLIKDSYAYLKASPAGRVLLTSSIAGLSNAWSGLSAYGASKAALQQLVRYAARELGPEGITVNAVAPGATLSDNIKRNQTPEQIAAMSRNIPLRRYGECDDIANTMLFLASDEGAYITGQTIAVDGGLSLVPGERP
jgi:3-oxoacyl-[acyl-carrier protein] reductase